MSEVIVDANAVALDPNLKVFVFNEKIFIGKLGKEDDTHYHLEDAVQVIPTPDGRVALVEPLYGLAVSGTLKLPKAVTAVADATAAAAELLQQVEIARIEKAKEAERQLKGSPKFYS